MKNILKNRWALSTVVTTLIILVVSVLLAGVVTYFAINVTSTRVQEENLSLAKQHVWVEMDGTAVAAIMITNTGGRDVVLGKIACRGQAADLTTQAWYVVADASDDLTVDLNYTAGATIDATAIFGGLSGAPAQPTSNSLVLTSGSTMVVYITSPDSVNANDIGLTLAITVFTSQAIHYKETNVEASI
jgi:heme/copper-type cytochrome/quinol oxidase subunit 2